MLTPAQIKCIRKILKGEAFSGVSAFREKLTAQQSKAEKADLKRWRKFISRLRS